MSKMVNFYDEMEDLELCGNEYVSEDYIAGLSAEDSFVYSMRNLGEVDLKYMSSISGIDEDELVNKLIGTAIFPDPAKFEKTEDYYGCFTSKQQLLRGNLIKKYEHARKLHNKTGLFRDTVRLLAKSIPDTIDVDDIHINLGSTWIPVCYVQDFIKKLLQMSIAPKVDYSEYLGKWNIDLVTCPNYVDNNYTYGTKRMSAVAILKHILNAKPVKVYDRVPKINGKEGYDSILNQAETLAAQEREKRIVEAWCEYIYNDELVRRHLEEVYMESFGYAINRYDGSFLDLADLNPSITPYEHQRNAIARVVLNHNTLLAHEVGSGKTLEYSCGVHELIRMKLGKKALIVVPNNNFESTVSSYKEYYPNDAVLAVYRKDFTPANRKETLGKMISSEYSVIFMPYSSFDMLTLSPEYAFRKKEKQLNECRVEIATCKNYKNRKDLEAEYKRLEKALEKYKEEYKISETACFDYLGVDILVVDEAHNYKNIQLDNLTENIVGVHSKGAKKADNMLEKVEYIESLDGHVIFATGTPITNSMADLYIMQRYLQPAELKLCNIFHFNDWINTFCSQSHSFEVDVDSKNFRFTTRFSKFHNLPEIMSMFSDVCDFYQINSGELGIPDFDGYTDVVVKKSEAQKVYIDNIAKRTEAIRARRVKRKEDNLLKITVDGRMCALDIRLVEPDTVVGSDENKAKVCARKILEVYTNNPGTCQIVFCDMSTPKEEFNVYDDLKQELIELGIPENEIMFIHDATTEAARNRIEKNFNAGKIRVLIGSTMKLGTGCNVQEKLIAVHHLDVPWRPADMVQREGRILRQGNTNKKVEIFRYVTESSFDSYTWQILENKQRFIAQFLSGSLNAVHRDESDCADTVLDYSEIKALAIGNPLIKERVEVSNELEHARINQRNKRKELIVLKEHLAAIPSRVQSVKNYISRARVDFGYYETNKKSISNDDRMEFGEALFAALKGNFMKDEERLFRSYQGFDIILPKHMKENESYVIVTRNNSNIYKIKMDGDKALGCSKRIDYVLEHLEDTIKEKIEALNSIYKEKVEAQKTLDAGNEFDELVEKLANKLDEIDNKLKESEKDE